jgi:uncharacterized integral membrane protein
MIRRILNWLILAPVALIAVVMAVANRAPVSVSFDPFNRDNAAASVVLPLFALVFVCLILGVVLGGVAVWFRQGQHRRRARKAEHELAIANEETQRLRSELARIGGTAPEPQSSGPLAFFTRPAA